jgi:hypothetical protein
MNRFFYVSLTGGTSIGPYNIYYDAVSPNNFATGFTSNLIAQNVTYAELTTGVGIQVMVPGTAQTIVVYNTISDGECPSKVFPIGSAPVNLPNICIEVVKDVDVTQYQFVLTDEIYNNRPTWSSSTYTIKWNSVNQYWFVENWSGGAMTSSNPQTPPISGWVVYGNNLTVTAYSGDCRPSNLRINNVIVGDPTCSSGGYLNNGSICNGSIQITPINGVPPYLYSINNGDTTSISPLFNGYCSGSYTAWVQDSVGNIVVQNVVIPSPPPPTQYIASFVTTQTNVAAGNNGVGAFITRRMDFTVLVTDSNNIPITQIPNGTVINFDIIEQNIFDTGPTINTGSGSRTIVVAKNGIPQTPTTSVTNSTYNNPSAACQGSLIYRTITSNRYVFAISGTDTISGYVISTVTAQGGGDTNCNFLSSQDTFSSSMRLIECSCCNINSTMTSPTLPNSIRYND